MKEEKVDYDKILIAHYDTGNVANPLDVLHDRTGNPLLMYEERIVNQIERAKSWVVRLRNLQTWRVFGGKFLLADTGEGTFYKTTERLIYLREPKPDRQLATYGPLGIPGQASYYLWAKDWKKEEKREGFSIPLKYIVRSRILSKGIIMYALCDNIKYQIIINTKTTLPPEMVVFPSKPDDKTVIVNCPYCAVTFPVVSTKRPLKVKCFSCGKKSMQR